MDKNKKHAVHGKHKKNGKTENYDEVITTCCLCVKTKKSKKKSLIAGCVTNAGIFIILIIYTSVGAFIFLAIEGSAAKVHQKTLATTSYQANLSKKPITPKANSTIAQATAELRSQTVESIWEITVSLNILYKENWTRLAAHEISKFQEKLVARVTADLSEQHGDVRALESSSGLQDEYEWNFAKAFLYSLTVLTTIGYGSVAPKTALGKAVTIGYAVIGIPLTLLYLSVVGALLSRLARGAFSRAVCCCLCVKCGYCCLDESIILKDRKEEKNRRPDEYKSHALHLQEPYYVRSPSGTIISASQANSYTNSYKDKTQGLNFLRDCDSMSCADTDSKVSLSGFSILAPICLCLASIFTYIFFGALVLYHLEGWSLIDGIYFCFMSLSTIGFGHLAPGLTYKNAASTGTVWFCSIYIITGLALTAMCFNVLHDEIVHRLKHHEKILKGNTQKVLTAEFLQRS
ncbi:potassium channel subfamily K member 18-like [Aricia agestis]|uniref:potassium channel subfamily K member 18-like n=1 Tax=Aricia agestis TaxID=91739 RepID=UPI001C209E17|nr:potassium channel subfamily K member 18-like [Aricia agestis]